MKLIKTYGTMFKIMMTIQTNSFIYLLRRIPVFSSLIPVSLYRKRHIKTMFSLGGLIKGILGSVIGSTLWCVLLLSWVPSLLLAKPQPSELLVIYLLVECLVPAVTSCGIFQAGESDYVFLNHFMVNPTDYYHYKIGKEAIQEIVVKLPVLIYFFRDANLVILACVADIFFTLGGCCWHLFLYDRLHNVVKKGVRRAVGFCVRVFAYAGLKAGLFGGITWGLQISVLLCIIMAAGSVVFYGRLLKYRDYKRIAVQFANKDATVITVTVSNSATEGENGLQPRDWKENREYYEKNKELPRGVYLNRAFLGRFRKIFSDQRKQIFLLSIPLGLLCGYVIRQGFLNITSETVLTYTPMLISFVSSCMLFGTRFTELCFRFVDMPMLCHGICDEEYVKQSLRCRYAFLIKHSLVALLGLTTFILLVLFVGGIRIPVQDVFFVLLSMELFMLIKESYTLLIYYRVQPYSADVSVKSPVFKALGMIESLFDFSVLFLRGNVAAACIPLLGIFFVVNLLLLFTVKNSQKTFRLRY